jgi:hypothetical protein
MYSITVITYVSDYCINITKMSDTCTLSQLSPMSLTTVSVSPRWAIPLLSLTVLYQYHQDEWYLYYITVITYVSDCTVSVSPRWVIPVLYHSYHLCLWLLYQVIPVIEYRYHSSWWYWYITVRDIGDNCDRVQVSLILVILIQYSQRHRW